MSDPLYIKGRGAQINPANRFLKQSTEKDVEHLATDEERELLLTENPATKYIDVYPKTIINRVESPDLPDYSMNPYQGCEHGCIYCYARNSHEYWGYSAGAEFEQNILIKKNAPELLSKALANSKWEAGMVMLAGNTDIYQPIERKMEITRKVLEVFYKFRHPVGMITKNALIQRDVDILEKLAENNLVVVNMTLTTLDEQLKRKLEPRTSSAVNVLKTIKFLTAHGIPVRIMMAPIIPSLNDSEIHTVIEAVADAGALGISYTVVRLNGQIGKLFDDWVRKNYPDRAEKIINQIKSLHGGQVNDTRYGLRMKGQGHWSDMVRQQFEVGKRKYLSGRDTPALNYEMHKDFKGGQLKLF